MTFKSIGVVDIHVNTRARAGARARICRVFAALALSWALLLAFSAAAASAVPPKVLEALGSDDVRVRVAAVVAVSKSGADNARLILETVARKDPAPPVRAAAIEGLERLGDPLALAAVRAALDDKAALVRKVARQAVAVLEAKTVAAYKRPGGMPVPIDLSDVRDLSGAGLPGLDKQLQSRLVEELNKDARRNWQVSTTPLKQGYGMLAKVRSITPFTQGDVSGFEITCDVTIVKLPGKALRLSLTATAAAGRKGKVNDDAKAGIASDGIDACAPALAKDFLDYAFQRPGP